MERLATLSTPDRLDRPFEDPLLDELFPPLATAVEWKLERMERALAMVGDPHRAYASLHVGGTNGKGSVTATLASIARAAGHRSGCYTSPHLVSFAERISVDGVPLSAEALKRHAAVVRTAVVDCELTFFEAVTVLALYAFAEEGVEVAALEVGLGGRLDATNVVMPEVSGVTNVGMDHADYLGDALLDIAEEKAGIMKPGVPFVTTEADPEVLALFERLAAEAGAPMSVVLPAIVDDVDVTRVGTSFRLRTGAWGQLELATPLVGRHQALNVALAVTMCERLDEDFGPDADAVVSGVADVVHRGRDELIEAEGCTWLLDVAHNPAGVASLADTMDALDLDRPVVGLVGILADKDWRGMLPPLADRCAHVVLTQPPTAPPERRWDPAAVAGTLSDAASVRVEAEFTSALHEAARLARSGTVVVTGSVHTVGGAMRMLETG